MSQATLIIQSDRFTAALARLMSTSKRTSAEIMRQQARLVFVEAAKITPPASEGKFGRAAEKQGRAAVAGDIASLYGTPGQAYDAVAATAPAAASAFWLLHQSGDDEAASKVVYSAVSATFSAFDGGTLHKRMMTRRGRVNRRKKHVFFVRDPAELEAYTAAEQDHVWWLASGWAEALRGLGARLPYGVGKLPAPGALRISTEGNIISITARNEVGWASDVRDLQRRVQWALDKQARSLDKRWDFYLKKLARDSGLKAT